MQISTPGVAIHSWTLYGLGICLILFRIICRWNTLRCITLRDVTKLQADDWVMLLVVIPFTGSVVCASQISSLPTVLDVEDLKWALKMRLTLEECQITTVWLVKTCLLVRYWRSPITTCRKGQIYLTWVSAYCFISYLVVQVFMAFWCHPVRDHWNPVSGNSQCFTYQKHSITTLAFNTTTLILLIYPLPFIRTPKKVLIAMLLGLGVTSLVAGIMGRYYIIAHNTSAKFLYWYPIETVALLLFTSFPFFGSLVTSTTSDRLHRVRPNLIVIQWPHADRYTQPRSDRDTRSHSYRNTRSHSYRNTRSHSYRDTRPLQATQPNCTSATTSPRSSVATTEYWNNTCGVPVSPLQVQVKTLRLTDPMPELEDYWSMRRSLTKDGIV